MNIYIGNLSPEISEEDLREAFEAFGQVTSVTIIKDRFSGESRGFGFVEMPSKAEAQSAMTSLKDKELKGHILKVGEARPRSKRPRGWTRTRWRGTFLRSGAQIGWTHGRTSPPSPRMTQIRLGSAKGNRDA